MFPIKLPVSSPIPFHPYTANVPLYFFKCAHILFECSHLPYTNDLFKDFRSNLLLILSAASTFPLPHSTLSQEPYRSLCRAEVSRSIGVLSLLRVKAKRTVSSSFFISTSLNFCGPFGLLPKT